MGWSYHNKPPMGWPLDYDSSLVPDAGFWLLNEGTGNKVFDLSGNGNTGTFVSDVTWKVGDVGPAIKFAGNNDYVTIPGKAIYNFAGPFTVVISSKPSSQDARQDIVTRGDPATEDYFYLRQETTLTGRYRFHVKAQGDTDIIQSDGPPSTTRYQQVVGRKDGVGNLNLFVDGILQADTDVIDSGALDTAVASPLKFGISFSNTNDHTGRLGYVYLYNRALSNSEIALLYREPFCMFKDPDEVSVLGSFGVPAGMVGAMTTNTGYWGW